LMSRKLDFQILSCALAGAAFFSLTISAAVLRYDALGAIWSAGAGMMTATLLMLFILYRHLAMDLLTSLIKPGIIVLAAIGVFYALHAAFPLFSLLCAFVILACGCYLSWCLTSQEVVWLLQPLRWVAKKMIFAR